MAKEIKANKCSKYYKSEKSESKSVSCLNNRNNEYSPDNNDIDSIIDHNDNSNVECPSAGGATVIIFVAVVFALIIIMAIVAKVCELPLPIV
jgi:hypothetical protein